MYDPFFDEYLLIPVLFPEDHESVNWNMKAPEEAHYNIFLNRLLRKDKALFQERPVLSRLLYAPIWLLKGLGLLLKALLKGLFYLAVFILECIVDGA